MQKKLLMAASLCAVGTLTPTLACNASHVLGAGGSGAVYTVSANTMEKGSFYLGLNVERVENKSLSDETILNAMQNGATHLHSIDSINSYSLSLSYGITDSLSLNVQLPYSSRNNIRAGEDNNGIYGVHIHGDSEGLGDTSTLLQYKVYDEAVQVAILGGVKIPTGKTDVEDEGEVLEADLQPGSGSWDFFAGAALSKNFENFSFHSNVLYKYNTKGVGDSELGDILTYNVALSHKLYEHEHDHVLRNLDEEKEFGYSIDVFIELNGESAEKDYFSGVVADNTGHNVIFATTGLQLITDDSYSLYMSISTPVYQNFNGVQNDISYKGSFGVGKSF